MRLYFRERSGKLRNVEAASLAHARNAQSQAFSKWCMNCFILVDGGKK